MTSRLARTTSSRSSSSPWSSCSLLTVGLAAIFSSPDEKPITMSAWANADTERRRRHGGRRARRNHHQRDLRSAVQQRRRGPEVSGVPCRRWAAYGSRWTPPGLVLEPLGNVAATRRWPRAVGLEHGPPDQRTTWATAYADALAAGPRRRPAAVARRRLRSRAGPVRRVPATGRSGGLEGALTSSGNFYGGDQTRSHCCCSPTGPTSRIRRVAPTISAVTSGA